MCPDVFVTAQGKSNVQVRKMECDVCKVQMEEGECLLHSVKVSCVTHKERLVSSRLVGVRGVLVVLVRVNMKS